MAGVSTGKAILVCVVAGLFCTYQFMLQGATSVMLPELMSTLSLDLEQVGWVTSAFLYAYLLCQLPGGALADRWSSRWLLVGCSLLMATACFWFSRSQSFYEACLARGLMGIATGPGIVVCLSLASRWFSERLFPAVSGMVESMAVMGGALGPLVLPELMGFAGWRFSILMLAVWGVILAAIIALVVRHQPGYCPESSGASPAETTKPFSLKTLLGNRQLWLSCCFGFGSFIIINTFAILWAIPFLENRFPDGQRLVHCSVSLIFAGLALGAPTFGFIVSVMGRCRLWMAISILAQMMFAGLVIFSSCSLGPVCVLCFLLGFSTGGYALAFTMVRDFTPAAMLGVSMAMANASMLLGGPILQPVIGAWVQSLAQQGIVEIDAFRMALPLITGFQVMALLSVLLMKGRQTVVCPARGQAEIKPKRPLM